MTSWTTTSAFLAGLCIAISALARPTDAGEFQVLKGRPTIDGKPINLPPRADGSQPIVAEEWLRLPSVEKRLALLTYWDRLPGAKERSVAFVIIDFGSGEALPSNPINSGQDLVWGDNNYVKADGDALYFGFFAPRRLQFVYRDGRLQPNNERWAGPSKPELYIVPPESDRGPCFNVANVPECLAERARYEAAAKRAKTKTARPNTAAPASAASGTR